MASAAVDRAEYAAYRVGAAIAPRIPPAVGDAGARWVGRALAHALPARRAQVARNLRRILGPVPDAELEPRVTRTFENYGRYWYELFRLSSESPDRLEARMQTDGYERLAVALDAGRGAIVALPHIGGWDFGAAWFTVQGHALTVVVEAVEPPELFEWFVNQRSAVGMDVVPLGPDAAARVARALHENRVVALLSDRDLTGDGIDVEFFGEQTTMPGGPALLALRTGAPILPVAVYFRPDGMHLGVMQEPVPTKRDGRLRDDVARVTQALARRFEALIRAAPEQWFVLQPNWPSDREA